MLKLHRRTPLWIVGVVPFALAACGGGDDTGATAEAGGGEAEVAAVAVENPGVVTGTVAFTGTPPAPQPIDMRDEPVCEAKHSTPPVSESVVVNENGTLRNVFVWVREGLTQPVPASDESPVLDQNGCMYMPHVMGVQAGQPFVVENSDAVLHNINAQPEVNRGFNISQPQEGMTSERTFSTQEVMVPVQCDVHGWMTAYIGVVDHPYYAVTGDDGSFRIENLPPGEYTLEAWHEQYGTQTMSVTVPPNGTAEAAFTFEAGAAAASVPAANHQMHQSASTARAGAD